MDYEKKYKEALERARDMLSYKEVRQEDMEYLFPELKESEDEIVKRTLILKFKEWKLSGDEDETWFGLSYDSVIAWLEKQGKQKPADKVEPKFNVGDWIVSDYNNVAYIESISETKYNLQCRDGHHEKMSIEYIDRCWHLWTIQDAKEGDVIFDKSDNTIGIFKCLGMLPDRGCNNDDSYCYLHCQYDPPYADITLDNDAFSEDVVPATKEQCDLLFAKMKEVGYDWEAEKKQVIKL